MNGRYFYNLINDLFKADNKVLSLYANPLINAREMFPEVQFVDFDGRIIPPFQSSASHIVLVEHLAGPFYDIPVKGIVINPLLSVSDNVIATVSTSLIIKDSLVYSKPILIAKMPSEVCSILKDVGDDNWYIEDNSNLFAHRELTDGLVQISNDTETGRI